MTSKNSLYTFLKDGVTFTSTKAPQLKTIYAPLCGTHSASLKSSITPSLSGDIKIDKFQYLTKPTSTEDLRQPVRNFYISLDGKKIISMADNGVNIKATVTIGQLWHKLNKKYTDVGLELEALNFIPVSGENVELMRISVKNISKKKIKCTPTAAIPIFARALANKHDHEHVTSLLNRIKQLPDGVLVEPTMSFNEEGHKDAHQVYFVFGFDSSGKRPVGSFPTVQTFLGDGGTYDHPQAVCSHRKPRTLTVDEIQGKEAVGALGFETIELKPGQTKEYFLVMGVAHSISNAQAYFDTFNSARAFNEALEKNKIFWKEKSHSIVFKTGDSQFNGYMHWVTLQPILRRIFGCSFLPDHDYGKGGKGWRDLWQDLLSLILIEPEHVKDSLINNFAGVRIDGSNATIIGSLPGEFLADRNMITRVWMDHGAWPFLTLLLYINQTGDFDILLTQTPYFKDPQLTRTFEKDPSWTVQAGRKLKTKNGQDYQGTILEHLLVQNLVQFFNVGEHNNTRLENADWNDGLDMAFARGESVTFMSFYGGNLLSLADLLEETACQKNIQTITVAKEIKILLDSLSQSVNYENVDDKKKLLFDWYCKSVQPQISSEQIELAIKDVARDLRQKGQWIFDHIRRQEKVVLKDGKNRFVWFNGYYDNEGLRVEGEHKGSVWMTLTGQVFPLMSGCASKEEVLDVVKAVNRYLKDKKLGGYRLNTNFGLKNCLDFGRAFGFAYGTKENGAFFSHMTVMYAYALYKNGFVCDGYEVLNSIYKMSMAPESKIYPGIPEYFDSEGKGMYHYLTGSASWLVLTQLTQAFGVRGASGDLILAPQLVKEQFSVAGYASVQCTFAGQKLNIVYENKAKLDFGQYKVRQVLLNNQPIKYDSLTTYGIKIKREVILEGGSQLEIKVILK